MCTLQIHFFKWILCLSNSSTCMNPCCEDVNRYAQHPQHLYSSFYITRITWITSTRSYNKLNLITQPKCNDLSAASHELDLALIITRSISMQVKVAPSFQNEFQRHESSQPQALTVLQSVNISILHHEIRIRKTGKGKKRESHLSENRLDIKGRSPLDTSKTK